MLLLKYVTGFAKTVPNRTKTEIKFIAEHSCTTKHMTTGGQVCFHRQLFACPVKPRRCTIGSLEPVNSVINKDVSGPRLLPMTVLTYPVD